MTRSDIKAYFDSVFERTQASTVGKSRRQKCKAAGHMVSAERGEGRSSVLLLSFQYMIAGFQPVGDAARVHGNLPSSG